MRRLLIKLFGVGDCLVDPAVFRDGPQHWPRKRWRHYQWVNLWQTLVIIVLGWVGIDCHPRWSINAL